MCVCVEGEMYKTYRLLRPLAVFAGTIGIVSVELIYINLFIYFFVFVFVVFEQ